MSAAAVLSGDAAKRGPGHGRRRCGPHELVAALRAMGAIGRDRAVPMRGVARGGGWTTRDVQYASAVANEIGLAVVTACDAPRGMYLAETLAELADYERQLVSRLRGNARRALHVRRMVRRLREQHAVDPLSGQLRWWA